MQIINKIIMSYFTDYLKSPDWVCTKYVKGTTVGICLGTKCASGVAHKLKDCLGSCTEKHVH